MQKQTAGGSPPLNPKNRILIAAAIFLLAFGVRVLSWHDTRLDVGKVQTAVTADYLRVAGLIRDGGLRSFLSPSSPLADPNTLGHPPGYSILWAALATSDTAIQFFQITADALCAVLIFLIVCELLSIHAGTIAGVLAALSPQFAWNSVLLLPDSLSVLPILAAVYLLVRATRNPKLSTFAAAGALIGISCWLRANAMFLTIFVGLAVPLLVKKAWPRFMLAVIGGTLLIVLPLTIRNAIVFHHFIPLSLGGGQTLLEGIGDYDKDNRFGIPSTDIGVMKQEAEIYRRPDYYGTLFNPDGVERERARLRRGFGVIARHPLWFAGVMTKRASTMVRLERSRLISREPPVSNPIEAIDSTPAGWQKKPEELFPLVRIISPEAKTSVLQSPSVKPDSDWRLAIVGDGSSYGEQMTFATEALQPDFDYVLDVPIKVQTGRVKLSVKSTAGRTYTAAVVEALESTPPEKQPVHRTILPFVPREEGALNVVLSNEASDPPHPSVQLGTVKLFKLGPSRYLWTRYPRFVVNAIQKLFLTAVMLPLAIAGLLILILRKASRALVILSIVPVYFFLVQSIVHTEYRYVLAVYFFMFAYAGLAIATICELILTSLRPWRQRSITSA